jgi:hypothetical protein
MVFEYIMGKYGALEAHRRSAGAKAAGNRQFQPFRASNPAQDFGLRMNFSIKRILRN